MRAGLASLALGVTEIIRQPFALDEHAYTSSVLVILALMALQLAAALIFALVVFFWALRGHYSAQRHLAVRNAWLYWVYLAVAWVVVLATLYAAPPMLASA